MKVVYTYVVLPEQLKYAVSDYKENFPCLDCREHFQSLLSMHPFPLEHSSIISKDSQVLFSLKLTDVSKCRVEYFVVNSLFLIRFF
jgi:hypothetical protein